MSIGFGTEDWLSPEFAFLFIQHNSSPFSPSLSLLGYFTAHEIQAQCLQGAIIPQCQGLLSALGWDTLDVNRVSEIPLYVFSLEFMHLSWAAQETASSKSQWQITQQRPLVGSKTEFQPHSHIWEEGMTANDNTIKCAYES